MRRPKKPTAKIDFCSLCGRSLAEKTKYRNYPYWCDQCASAETKRRQMGWERERRKGTGKVN